MKKFVLMMHVIALIFFIYVFHIVNTKAPDPETRQILQHGYKSSEDSTEELYQDIFMALLHPYLEKAVEDYYGTGVLVDPWNVKVLNIERPNGYRTFSFVLKLEVIPYVHSHLSMGLDRITISVSTGGVKIEKFEHVKSFDDLEQYRKAHPINPENKG